MLHRQPDTVTLTLLCPYMQVNMLITPSIYSQNTRTRSPDYFLTVDGDPHFIIELPNKNDALCFNIKDKPGTIFNLVKDPLTGECVEVCKDMAENIRGISESSLTSNLP